MRNPQHCRKLLEIILGISIRNLEYVEEQKTIRPDYDARSIRLDIYAEDAENTVYNVEMQSGNHGHLPKRSRYYQSVIDINMIEKGTSYKQLKKSLVIFICTFDLFGEGRYIYSFENRCLQNPELILGDEAVKIFVNTKGDIEAVDEEFQNLMAYFNGEEPRDEYTKALQSEVMNAKYRKEWRVEYMKLEILEQDIREEYLRIGIEQGIEQGREQGIEQGIEQGREQERIKIICDFLSNGGTEEMAVNMLNATLEEITKAKEPAMQA